MTARTAKGQCRYADAAAVLVLAAVTVIGEWQLLVGGTMLGMDTATAFYPWYSFLGDRLRSGQIPLWNPHQFSGTPFAADPESGWMYLPAMLLFTFLPLSTAAKSYMLLHLLLAGITTYALGRTLGIGVAGALLAATAYAFSGFLYGHHLCCFAYASVAAWLPLMVLGVERAIRSEDWRALGLWWGVAGLALSQILAAWVGQGSYYALLVLGGYVSYRTLCSPKSETGIRDRLADLVLHIGGVLLFGFGLAAAGLLPRLEYNALSNLPGGYSKSDPDVVGPALASSDPIAAWDLIRGWDQQLLVPGFHYAGAVTLALALVALLVAGARHAVPYFAALSLAVLILAREERTLLHSTLSLLPAFDRLHEQSPGRLLIVFYLGPALLAGATLANLGKRGRKASFAAIIPLLAALWLWTSGLPVAPTTLGALICAAALVATYPLIPRQRSIVAALLLLVLLVDLHVARQISLAQSMKAEGAYKLRQVDLAEYYEPTGAGRFLKSKAEAAPFRYFGYAQHVYGDPIAYTLNWADPATTALEVNNRALISGLHDIQGYNPIHVARYDEFMAVLNGHPQNYHHTDVFEGGLSSPLLDLLNVRYIVLPAGAAPDQTTPRMERVFPTVYQDSYVKVVENPEALPRAWIVHSAQQVGQGEALDLLATRSVDPRQIALLEQSPPGLAAPARSARDEARVTTYEADRMQLRTTTGAPGLLILSEVYYPAWKAYVDGHPTRLYVANHALRAVSLPAGEHTVELRYESPTLSAGLAISVAAYALLVGLALAAWTRRRVGCGGQPACSGDHELADSN